MYILVTLNYVKKKEINQILIMQQILIKICKYRNQVIISVKYRLFRKLVTIIIKAMIQLELNQLDYIFLK